MGVCSEQLAWWKLYGFVMVFNTLNFALAKYLNDLSIVDITWGIMFTIPNAILIMHKVQCGIEITLQMKIVMVMVTVWGVRLVVHIGARHKGEDYRYKMIKARWNKCSAFGKFMAGYLYIFAM